MKRVFVCALLTFALTLLPACTPAGPDDPTDPTEPSEVTIEKSYSEMREDFIAGKRDVNTRIVCTISDKELKASFTIKEREDVFTATDNYGNEFSCGKEGITAGFFTRASFLPPYDTLLDGTDTPGEYRACFSGSGVLAFLLTGSSFFSGYSATGCAQLVGDCVYTVHTDADGINDYNYDFTLHVEDSGEIFDAHVNIYCEKIIQSEAQK